jgi:RND family efflux transporter MFP subunit
MTKAYVALLLSSALSLGSCDVEEKSKSKPEAATGRSETVHTVHLSREQQDSAHVTIEAVSLRRLKESIRVPGRIDFNQERLAHVTARVPGRVEQVYAFLGDRVPANGLLATIYSQQYLTAQGEFIQARQRLTQADARGDSADVLPARAILESARRKLLVLGATEKDVQDIAQTQAPKTLLEIRSPFAGSVTQAGEILGHFVEVGVSLFHVANLSHLWVIADIYEKDLARLQTGLDATIQVSAYPNETFKGHLTRIFDVLDEKTHTVKARVEVHNPQAKLKPQMYGTVMLLLGPKKNATLVSEKAVQIEGEQRVVYVAVDDSSFVKRYVYVGQHQDGFVEITGGLNAGERVVTEGAFTIKSEFQKSELAEE